MARSKIKTISLETKSMKVLVELLFRGLSYTDEYYNDEEKMWNLWENVLSQLHEQGAKTISNGEITF